MKRARLPKKKHGFVVLIAETPEDIDKWPSLDELLGKKKRKT